VIGENVKEAIMPTPFPGMDPYLERPGLWEDVHTRLIVAIADMLGPQVRPRYRVSVEQRTYLTVLTPDEVELVGRPDVLVVRTPAPEPASAGPTPATYSGIQPQVAELPMPDEVVERYLEVRDVATGEAVTVIELLSPTNKLKTEGRDQYERKRLKVLSSATHLVEIDLLRSGQPFPFWIQGRQVQSDYRIVVSRAQHRSRADVYLFSVRDPIPDIPIPLRPGEAEPVLPLNQLLHTVYDRAGYDLIIDYLQPPAPPLAKEDMEWLKQLLQRRNSE
jgi:hypothetical protein